MTETLPRVVGVSWIEKYQLRVEFSDGLAAVLDWNDRLQNARSGGIFEPLKDPEYFSRVQLWPEAGTINWPNGADICPTVLYEWAKRAQMKRVG